MFVLTRELVDDIVFRMEDQGGVFVIDVRTGSVEDVRERKAAGGDGGLSGGVYAGLPAWTPADGFGLMESFTASLKNPPARKRLAAALNRGKGVFRAFKDAVGAFPEVEKRWLGYKNRALQRVVRVWYAALCEEADVKLIGAEPEETGELIDEDFHFAVVDEGGRIMVTAWNALDCQAGRIAAHKVDGGWCVGELFVEESFRGLGLGACLLKRLLAAGGGLAVTLDLPFESEVFARVLLRENFVPSMTRYRRPPA